jgi:hypothetical protein
MQLKDRDLNKLVDDMLAFILFARLNGKHEDGNNASILIFSTLSHDIGGVIREDLCFSPRVTGYSKDGKLVEYLEAYLKKLKEAKVGKQD